MKKTMYIDAMHRDDIRLVVCENGKIQNFEFQSGGQQRTKGNIYLVKVDRVEPSLQAAFVDLGEGKTGFLPFSEIHPDYFNIPVSDKEEVIKNLHEKIDINKESNDKDEEEEDDEKQGGKVLLDCYQNYKIQEVVKKDQVLLVQVVKESRGNKGASLTTYISLPGRFCVLFPNSRHSGGVSKKIEDEDRERLKNLTKEFAKKSGSGSSLIIRTAGLGKTKTEITRDFDYLMNLWNKIRDLTLNSVAPACIYDEGNVIKRGIRDLFHSDMSGIIVAGAEAFKECKDFMSIIAPLQVDKITKYNGKVPIFVKHDIEVQLRELYSNVVPLASGGSLVINVTEAMIAIDVNSGRSTNERNVEGTAFKTNMEAVVEIARQIRLRDLAGIIAIDFIDMMKLENRLAVENAMRKNLAYDRARYQCDRINIFGVFLLSRQRLNNSFIENTTLPCPRCDGKGRVRSIPALALSVLRAVEHEANNTKDSDLKIISNSELILHILNYRRSQIAEIEKSTKVKLFFEISNEEDSEGFYLEAVSKSEQSESSKVITIGEKDEEAKAESGRRKIVKGNNKPQRSGGKKFNRKKTKEDLTTGDDNADNINEYTPVESNSSGNSKDKSLLKEIWKKIVE